MSLVRNEYALSTRRELLGALCSALLALALFDPGVATAQQGKEIKLPEKHIQSFMDNDMVKVYESADPDKPDDPKVEAQVEAIAKKNGFASLAEFDDVSVSISAVMSGIDPQTKKFTEPPEQIKKEIAALKADKTIPDAQKKEDLAELEAELKTAKPIQFKDNITLVLEGCTVGWRAASLAGAPCVTHGGQWGLNPAASGRQSRGGVLFAYSSSNAGPLSRRGRISDPRRSRRRRIVFARPFV